MKKNDLAKKSELFIFCDAAKNEDTIESVEETRDYVKSIDGFKRVTIIERERNFGLADSIVDGVTQIANKHGKVIVLEDDIKTNPLFLKYMNKALDFYQNEKSVMHISGYMVPFIKYGLQDAFFLKPATCWGWATWDRAWKHYRNDTEELIALFSEKMIKDFNINNSYDYFSHLLANHKGELKTWAIFWYASVFLKNGLSLHPKYSFTQNIGFDGSGEHCKSNDFFSVDIGNVRIPSFNTIKIGKNRNANLRLMLFYLYLNWGQIKVLLNIIKKNSLYKV